MGVKIETDSGPRMVTFPVLNTPTFPLGFKNGGDTTDTVGRNGVNPFLGETSKDQLLAIEKHWTEMKRLQETFVQRATLNESPSMNDEHSLARLQSLQKPGIPSLGNGIASIATPHRQLRNGGEDEDKMHIQATPPEFETTNSAGHISSKSNRSESGGESTNWWNKGVSSPHTTALPAAPHNPMRGFGKNGLLMVQSGSGGGVNATITKATNNGVANDHSQVPTFNIKSPNAPGESPPSNVPVIDWDYLSEVQRQQARQINELNKAEESQRGSQGEASMFCDICGDKATGLHYGIISCEG